MDATFVAPDLVVLAHVVQGSDTVEDFKRGLDKLMDGDYNSNVKAIVSSPINLRFGWVKLRKTEEEYAFFSNLTVLDANNTFSPSDRGVIMTQHSVFANLNLIQTFKEVSKGEDGAELQMDIDLSNKVDRDSALLIAKGMFESTRFYEIIRTDGTPELYLLAGNFTNDTWAVLSTVGSIARKSPAMQKDSDGKDARHPGLCLLFGNAAMSISQIINSSDKFAAHVKADFDTFPREDNAEA